MAPAANAAIPRSQNLVSILRRLAFVLVKPMCHTRFYPSAMRVLLKDVRTGKYFQRQGVWVQHAEEAHDFKSGSRAIEAWARGEHLLLKSGEHDLLEVVLHSVRRSMMGPLVFERVPEPSAFLKGWPKSGSF